MDGWVSGLLLLFDGDEEGGEDDGGEFYEDNQNLTLVMRDEG